MEFTPDQARALVTRLSQKAPSPDLASIVGPTHPSRDTDAGDCVVAETFGQLDPAALLRVVDAGLTALQCADLGTETDSQIITGLDTVDEFRARTDAVFLRYVAHVDHTRAQPAGNTGATSTATLLTTRRGISPSRAKADVAAATAVHGKRPTTTALTPAPIVPGALGAMGDLLAAGQIRVAHIDTAVRTVERIPRHLLTDGDKTHLAQSVKIIAEFFADQSPTTRPQTLNGLAKELLRSLDPDTDDHYDPHSFERRNLTMGTDPTGMTFGTFQLDPAAAAEFRACLDPLSAPKPDQTDADGNVMLRDDRSPGQRRADGFIEMVRLAADKLKIPSPGLDHGEGSVRGEGSVLRPGLFDLPAAPPNVNEQNGHGNSGGSEACEALSGSRAGKFRPGRRGPRVFIVTTLDQIAAVQRGKPPDPPCMPDEVLPAGGPAAEDPPRHGRPDGSPLGDDPPATGRPDGSPPADGQRGAPEYAPIDPTPSHCDQIGEISPGTLARMTCDALFQRVVQGPNGAILDLGMAVRLAGTAQRGALQVRDKGCTFPGCDRPPGWCDCHHVRWYSRGGETSVANMALLCPAHHSLIHTGRWQAEMFDGIPYYRHAPGDRADRPYIYGTTATVDDWIRNSYFDQLRQAREAAAAVLRRRDE